MATYTQNLDLKKPAQSDKIRIADINNNMDTIDGAVGDIGERSIAAQIGDVEGALAIVSTGNVHGAITSGQYVYVKKHDTLDDGLYVATTNISANGTLSSSNVTADSAGGGLNALNGKITKTVELTNPSAVNTSDGYAYWSISSLGLTNISDMKNLLASLRIDGNANPCLGAGWDESYIFAFFKPGSAATKANLSVKFTVCFA